MARNKTPTPQGAPRPRLDHPHPSETGFQGVQQSQRMSDLNERQLRAIEGLLSSTSVEGAARESGLSSKTIRRYLSQPDFRALFRGELRERVHLATARMQAGSAAAVECLLEIMQSNSESSAARTRAAIAILDLTRRWIEVEDTEVRLVALETAYAKGALT